MTVLMYEHHVEEPESHADPSKDHILKCKLLWLQCPIVGDKPQVEDVGIKLESFGGEL